jgi:hypothetical protein
LHLETLTASAIQYLFNVGTCFWYFFNKAHPAAQHSVLDKMRGEMRSEGERLKCGAIINVLLFALQRVGIGISLGTKVTADKLQRI